LKGNFDSISEKHSHLRREYDITVKEKNEIEQATHNATIKLKAHLDEKTKDIEQLKQKVMTPKYALTFYIKGYGDCAFEES
jgi:predicted RNase H-like nuclease (RuvC/YqgF family)